jgi:adenosylcobinamide kinase/adenosylcobinamide-phosphate guanylyltransferase
VLTLVIGGARSGKSRFAQSLCEADGRVVFIATAREEDDEMRSRIERHRQSRAAGWMTIEEPLALVNSLRGALAYGDVFLIDCLTIWLSNLMWELRDRLPEDLEKCAMSEIEEVADIAAGVPRPHVIVVSNEVGGGLVPENGVGRRFRDLQGLVNQRCAARADRVFLMVAGIAIPVKPGVA